MKIYNFQLLITEIVILKITKKQNPFSTSKCTRIRSPNNIKSVIQVRQLRRCLKKRHSPMSSGYQNFILAILESAGHKPLKKLTINFKCFLTKILSSSKENIIPSTSKSSTDNTWLNSSLTDALRC